MDSQASTHVAKELRMIADEVDAAASALSARLQGRSRELRAWAARLRMQADILTIESDRGAERDPEVAERAATTGLHWAAKAALVLSSVTAIANAPAAVVTAHDAVDGSIALISEIVDSTEAVEKPEASLETSTHIGMGHEGCAEWTPRLARALSEYTFEPSDSNYIGKLLLETELFLTMHGRLDAHTKSLIEDALHDQRIDEQDQNGQLSITPNNVGHLMRLVATTHGDHCQQYG